MEFKSIAELVTAAEELDTKISDIVIASEILEMELSEKELLEQMDLRFFVMEQAAENGQKEGLRSNSGLTGGDGFKMMNYAEAGQGVLGGAVDRAVATAVGVAEYNASMGRIVAAPTAGSCGIMPGCLVSLMKDGRFDRETIVRSMFTASAVGVVIATKASIAGASGGCQAECGSAAAMTAAALVELMGGTPAQASDAVAIALKNQLGLVCDPVAGLVEIPCIKRNAQGVVTAFCAADMAMAGIRSNIPADEVIGAMKEVSDLMDPGLKETACAGLAATPTGLRLKAQVFGE